MSIARVLLGCSLLAVGNSHGAETPTPATAPNAVHILGLGDAARHSKGILKIENGKVSFRSETLTAQIPLNTIAEFTIEEESRGLLQGNAGRLLLLAPFGSGRAISMIRTGVELLTLQYTDVSGGLHGCILLLPKGSSSDFAEKLKAGGVRKGDAPQVTAPEEQTKREAVLKKEQLRNAVLEIRPILGTDTGLPAEFRVSIYEQLYDGLWKTGQFLHVYRAGDRNAETKPERLIVNVTVESFQKGNERLRSLTPFGGATVIKARVQVQDAHQGTLVDRDLSGSVRTYGDNLEATDSLAKKIAKLLKPKGGE